MVVIGSGEAPDDEGSRDDNSNCRSDLDQARSPLRFDRFHHAHDIIETDCSVSDNRGLVRLSATAAFVILGCTWAFAIARYGGPDEPAHVLRAAAVAHADLLGQPSDSLESGYRQVTVPAPLASGDPACYRHSETTTAACAAPTTGSGTVDVATSAGTAPPWYYALVGLIARVLSSGSSVLGYRMASVVLCAFILGHAVARSRRFGASAWLVAAITPSTWFLIGVVGTSGIEVALVVVALVEAVGRFHQPGAEPLTRVTVPLAACLLLRPAAVIDVVVVALVVAPTVVRPVTRRTLLMLSAPFAVVGVASVAWSQWVGFVLDDRRTADANTAATTVGRSLSRIPLTVHQTIGALGWNEFFAPLIAQVVWAATLVFAIWWVFTRGSDRWWHVRWAFVALVLPTIVEVVVHRRIGHVWQGRYSIAFAIGGVLYAARFAAPSRAVMRAVVIAGASAEVLTLWQSLRRYMVGLDGSMLLRHASWRPPVNPWLLLVLNGVAVAWLATAALRSGTDVAEHVHDVVGRAGVVVDRQATV
jgi:Predicted membrane protein (DUF2142)